MNSIKKYILLFFAACIAMTACVKEDMNIAGADDLVSFNAVYENPASKTVMDGLTPMWTPQDTISIYDGNNNVFTNSLTENALSAEFKGKLEGQGIERGSFMAASPYNANYTFSFVGNFVGGMQVLPVQTAVEGGYDPKSAPAAAYTDSTTISFHNAYALIKFTIVSDGVTEVTLAGNQGEAVAGKMNVAQDEPVRINVTKPEAKVTLQGEFKKGSVYYMSVIPAVLQSGFTMTLKSAAGASVESLKYANKVSFNRSEILNVGELSLTPAVQTPDDENKDENGGNGSDNEDTGNNGGNTAAPGTVYLHPNSNWNVDGARFAVYFFVDETTYTWVDMTGPDADGCYECKIPEGGYTNLIFVRMNHATTENNWDNKWNQSADLEVPSGNSICYVLYEGQWGGDGLGYWTTYPPVIEDQPGAGGNTGGDNGGNAGGGESGSGAVRIYLSNAWGWPYIWCWDSASAQIFGNVSWPGTRYHGEENGYYYWNVPESYVGKTVSLLAVKEDQSEQTSDYTGVVLDKDVYFYLEWAEGKGCYLVKENK